ncbi:MAG: hypothetical protein JO165_00765 [Candidatus Eremiobacteraeota bacterium]|nr:hypothetical protein [Candidatus Eremiobacteraeota bacterium]
MSPPTIAQAIVAISAPPKDVDSVCGDLHEEYVRIVARDGSSRADAWYWNQAIRSVPSLLSYSRAPRSLFDVALTAVIVLVAIVGMLCANDLIDESLFGAYRATHGGATWPYFLVGSIDAAAFGALIASLRPSYGMRLVLFSACGLVAFIAVPILLQFSSRLTGPTWLLILCAASSMCVGGCGYHFISRRLTTGR